MRRIAFTLPPDRAEEAVDALMPLLPQGVYERALDDGAGRGRVLRRRRPTRRALDALAGDALLAREEEEVPDDAARAPPAAPATRGRSRGGCACARPTTRPARTALPEIVIEPRRRARSAPARTRRRG